MLEPPAYTEQYFLGPFFDAVLVASGGDSSFVEIKCLWYYTFMSTETISSKSKIKSTYQLISIALYVITIIFSSGLLLIEPNNFDARRIIIPLIVLLLISALGIGQKITSKNTNKAVSLTGAILIAVLLTFIGFFIVAGVAWFIGVSHT